MMPLGVLVLPVARMAALPTILQLQPKPQRIAVQRDLVGGLQQFATADPERQIREQELCGRGLNVRQQRVHTRGWLHEVRQHDLDALDRFRERQVHRMGGQRRPGRHERLGRRSGSSVRPSPPE